MKILLLLTTGMSLKKWYEIGQLSRELEIYSTLAEKIGHIYIYSYGKNENTYVNNKNISVISKPKYWPIFKNYKLEKISNLLFIMFTFINYSNIFKNIDLIKTNQFNGSLLGILLKKIYKKKLIIRMGYYHTHLNINNYDNKKILKRMNIEKKYFSLSDFIIVTTIEAKYFIENKYKLSNVYYIPNYININLFKPLIIKKEYDILFIGRLEKEKNLEVLLRAIKGLKCKVIFIGKGSLKERLLNIAKYYNVNLKIISMVPNNEISKYINKSKIFILPSIFEGNPKVLLEAMSCGSVIIGNNVPGINNIIKNKYNGLLFNGNVNDLREKILMVLNSEIDIKNLTTNARNTIIKNNDLKKLIKKEINLIKKIKNKNVIYK